MSTRVKQWCYKWLPILFGCHCRDDRSFHWKGKKFPICARCTGMLAGLILFCPLSFAFLPQFFVCLLLMVPLIADGILQMKTAYESTNLRRLVTGILFGYALPGALIQSMIWSYNFGYQLSH